MVFLNFPLSTFCCIIPPGPLTGNTTISGTASAQRSLSDATWLLEDGWSVLTAGRHRPGRPILQFVYKWACSSVGVIGEAGIQNVKKSILAIPSAQSNTSLGDLAKAATALQKQTAKYDFAAEVKFVKTGYEHWRIKNAEKNGEKVIEGKKGEKIVVSAAEYYQRTCSSGTRTTMMTTLESADKGASSTAQSFKEGADKEASTNPPAASPAAEDQLPTKIRAPLPPPPPPLTEAELLRFKLAEYTLRVNSGVHSPTAETNSPPGGVSISPPKSDRRSANTSKSPGEESDGSRGSRKSRWSDATEKLYEQIFADGGPSKEERKKYRALAKFVKKQEEKSGKMKSKEDLVGPETHVAGKRTTSLEELGGKKTISLEELLLDRSLEQPSQEGFVLAEKQPDQVQPQAEAAQHLPGAQQEQLQAAQVEQYQQKTAPYIDWSAPIDGWSAAPIDGPMVGDDAVYLMHPMWEGCNYFPMQGAAHSNPVTGTQYIPRPPLDPVTGEEYIPVVQNGTIVKAACAGPLLPPLLPPLVESTVWSTEQEQVREQKNPQS